MKVLVVSTLISTLYCHVFNFSQSTKSALVCHCSFHFHFLHDRLCWVSFHVLIWYYILLWWSVTSFAQFFNWVVYFLIYEFWGFFIYSGYKSFIIYVFYKYFVRVHGLCFHSPTGFTWRAEILHFDEVHFITFFLLWFVLLV